MTKQRRNETGERKKGCNEWNERMRGDEDLTRRRALLVPFGFELISGRIFLNLAFHLREVNFDHSGRWKVNAAMKLRIQYRYNFYLDDLIDKKAPFHRHFAFSWPSTSCFTFPSFFPFFFLFFLFFFFLFLLMKNIGNTARCQTFASWSIVPHS